MTLDELLFNRLSTSETITGGLSKFNSSPAIFYQSVPGDKDPGWKGAQFPRLVYTIELQSDPERQTSGQMVLDIMSVDTGASPESIESAVREALRDIFMTPTNEPPCCFVWRRSDSFEESTAQKFSGIQGFVGITIVFDMLAFPVQETTDPDPVMALNNYIKRLKPSATVIGKDTLPDYYSATKGFPAFYSRLISLERERETNSVIWMTASLGVHVFAPTVGERLEWLKYVTDQLSIDGEIIMLDRSPMFLLGIRADSTADYLSSGQLRLSVRYGILRMHRHEDTMNIGTISQ